MTKLMDHGTRISYPVRIPLVSDLRVEDQPATSIVTGKFGLERPTQDMAEEHNQPTTIAIRLEDISQGLHPRGFIPSKTS